MVNYSLSNNAPCRVLAYIEVYFNDTLPKEFPVRLVFSESASRTSSENIFEYWKLKQKGFYHFEYWKTSDCFHRKWKLSSNVLKTRFQIHDPTKLSNPTEKCSEKTDFETAIQ